MHALIQQVIATEPAPPILRQLVAWTGRHLSLKQSEGGHFLIGGGWPGTIDDAGATHVTRSSLEGNLALAARALPGIRGVRVTRAWTGLAPNLTRAPVISPTPGLPGLWHAVSGNGYTLGPVMGRMLAYAVLGRSTLPAAFAL
jgi:glycine/D-amino acid oxidase-like deaminating enzyme